MKALLPFQTLTLNPHEFYIKFYVWEKNHWVTEETMPQIDFNLEDVSDKYIRHKYQVKMWYQQSYVLIPFITNNSDSIGLKFVIANWNRSIFF